MGLKIDTVDLDALTSDPTTPADGELWYHSTEERHKVRINGATYGIPTVYEWAESTEVSTRTSSTYGQKLRLTTSTLPAGDYRIGWSYETGNSADDKIVRVRVQVDDTTTLLDNASKNKGKADDTPAIYNPASGFAVVTLTAASHTVDLDWAAESDTAYIRNARLEIWRLP